MFICTQDFTTTTKTMNELGIVFGWLFYDAIIENDVMSISTFCFHCNQVLMEL